MEKLLKTIVKTHGAEIFRFGKSWIVSSADEFWDYLPLMEILTKNGFIADEGVDLNGEYVLVVNY